MLSHVSTSYDADTWEAGLRHRHRKMLRCRPRSFESSALPDLPSSHGSDCCKELRSDGLLAHASRKGTTVVEELKVMTP
jgi:hypothetical protein